jgi:mRNA interferase YafQ
MLQPAYTRQFQKDLKKIKKRGKDIDKIKTVIKKLAAQTPLEDRYRDHKLVGNYHGRRECHVEPDWLLVYKLNVLEIIFERTGSHSDLFKK